MFANEKQNTTQSIFDIRAKMSNFSGDFSTPNSIRDLGISSSNSFVRIKYSLDNLNKLLDKKVSENLDDLEDEISAIETIYANIIDKCQGYLKEPESPSNSKVEETRKILIQELLSQSNIDYQKFLDAKTDIIKVNSKNKTWREVLSDIRTEEIDITGRDDLGITGGVISEVLTIGKGEDMRFFKDEEKLKATNQYMANYIKKLNISIEDKKTCALIIDFVFKENFAFVKDYLKENNETNKNAIIRYLSSHIDKLSSHIDKSSFHIDESSINKVQDQLIPIIKIARKKSALAYNAKLAQIDRGSIISNRNVAASRLASLLGVENIIAKSTNARIIENGQVTRQGNIMDKAKGMDYSCMYKTCKHKGMTGEFQRQLICLQMLDTLSAQIDRHCHNYFYQTSQKDDVLYLNGVQGIDNDLCFGKITDLKKGVSFLPNFVDETTGETTLEFADRDLTNNILSISPEILRYTFLDLLSDSEIDALLTRLKIMQDALKISINLKGKNFLKNPEEWGEETDAALFDSKKTNYFKSLCKNFVKRK